MAPAVSVVIPVYNRETSIARAVESVLAQTFADFELILVDDASTDRTREVIATLKDPRIRLLVHDRNGGAGAARNTGLRAAAADWVAFQDSDDEWLPEKLRRQMDRLAGAEADCCAVYCGMEVENLDNRNGPKRYVPDPSIRPREGRIFEQLLTQSFVSTQTLMVRRDAALQVGGFDPALPALEDWEFMIRLSQCGSVALVDEPLVRQSFSENSLTRSLQRWFTARLRIMEKHRALLAERPRVLALHHAVIAGALRRMGKPADLLEADIHLAQAVRLDPRNRRYRLVRLLVRLKRLVRR